MRTCECFILPSKGVFIVGNKYTWDYIIDGIVVIDENQCNIFFGEIESYWYFKKIN
jgi:hypothetical protein